jgi:50S ribosomal protein L16 3-hydroxylase
VSALLGGISPATFLREHWQRRPRLVRQAVPGFRGLVDRRRLLALATRADVTSRLVIDHGARARRRWERHDGPFGVLDEAMLPARAWTLLVHGLERVLPGGWELLRKFAFLPLSRIDDLMVSFAADGGSVGPHDDRYDVFLLQGPGRRRWQIASGGDRTRDPRAAISVLARFEPEEEWVLESGDMLYLPPGIAHYGVAEGPCFTYSIGFLAPSQAELVRAFYGYLAGIAALDEEELYRDAGLPPPRDPLAVPPRMIEWVRAQVDRHTSALRPRAPLRLVEDFLGSFLTRPRPGVGFTAARALAVEALARRLRGRGRLRLALATRALMRGRRIFVNGRAYGLGIGARRSLAPLLRERALALPARLDAEARELVRGWIEEGWVELLAV